MLQGPAAGQRLPGSSPAVFLWHWLKTNQPPFPLGKVESQARFCRGSPSSGNMPSTHEGPCEERHLFVPFQMQKGGCPPQRSTLHKSEMPPDRLHAQSKEAGLLIFCSACESVFLSNNRDDGSGGLMLLTCDSPKYCFKKICSLKLFSLFLSPLLCIKFPSVYPKWKSIK